MKKSLARMISFLMVFNVIFFSSAIFAQSTAVEMLNQKLSSFHSLSAEFNQTVSDKKGAILQTSTGTVALLRPGRFRWSAVTPLRQEIITDGKTVWIDEPDLQQVTIRRLTDDLQQTPLLLLTQQKIVLQNSFTVTQPTPNSFLLIPKHAHDLMSKININFNGNTPQSLELWNNFEQKTVIEFTHTKMNISLNPAAFIFHVPKGMDVIDMTRSS